VAVARDVTVGTEAGVNSVALLPGQAQDRQRRATGQLLLARGVFFASAYVVSAVLARQLMPAEYGVYGVILSQVLWLEMVVTAGIPAATSKLIADGRHDPDDVERSARALLIGVSIVLFAVCWAAAPAAERVMHIAAGASLLRLALFDLPFAALYASYEGVLYGHRRFAVLARAQVVYAVTRVCAVLALLIVGISVERSLLAIVLSSVVVCTVLLSWFPPRGMRPRGATMREIGRFAGPMALCLVGGQVLVIVDLWALQTLWTGSSDVVGHYVASLNIARALMIVPTVQAGVLFTSVAWASSSGDVRRAVPHIREAMRFALVVSTAACVIVGMDAAPLLALLFSAPYAAGQPFLVLQLAGFGLFALLDVLVNALMASGRQRTVALVLTLLVPFAFASNYLLIGRLGAVGASVALVAGVAIGTAVTSVLVRLHFGAFAPWMTIVRVGIAGAAVAVASNSFAVEGPLVLVKLVVLGGMYVSILLAFRELSWRDLGLRRTSEATRG
jgi:O-antigen/teichoic acid export membrane protein